MADESTNTQDQPTETQTTDEQQAAATEPTAPEIPDWVVDKFHKAENPIEAQAKAYRELEQHQGRLSAQLQEYRNRSDTPVDVDFDTAINEAGLNPQELIEAYNANGAKLSEEQYAKLAEKGVGKSLADAFMKLKGAEHDRNVAFQEQCRARAHEIAGGEDQFNVIMQYANVALSAAEQLDFQRRLNDPSLYEGAVRDMMARRTTDLQAGNSTSIVGGRATALKPVTGFTSKQEWREARSRAAKNSPKGDPFDDPNYVQRLQNTDPAIRKGLF